MGFRHGGVFRKRSPDEREDKVVLGMALAGFAHARRRSPLEAVPSPLLRPKVVDPCRRRP